MENENMENETFAEDSSAARPPKKRRAGLIIFLIVLIAAVAASVAYYFIQKQKPENTVTEFLSCAQDMDFDKMADLLQSNDLSALDNADIRNDNYIEFFRSINKKMTFEIIKNDFDIQNGTAQVTAHITHIDGSKIYKEAISEFIRQTFSSAFSGETLSEEENQQRLAALLMEKAEALEDSFTATDITYPVILAGDQWKIVSLDNATVEVMSANFKNMEDEINNTLVDLETNEDDSDSESSADGTINLTTERFTIHYTQYRIAKDFAGKPCLLLYYDYTNNSDSASSAMVDVSILAYQDGETLDAAIPEDNEEAIDRYMSEIQPGTTVNVCQAYALNSTSDVTLEATEAFALGGGQVSSQTVKVQ